MRPVDNAVCRFASLSHLQEAGRDSFVGIKSRVLVEGVSNPCRGHAASRAGRAALIQLRSSRTATLIYVKRVAGRPQKIAPPKRGYMPTQQSK
jgi:hypothetical protein